MTSLKKCGTFSNSQRPSEENNHFKSNVSTFKFLQDPKDKREWLIKMKRECLMFSQHQVARLCKVLYRRQLRTKSCCKEFVEILLQASSSRSQERPMIFDFIMEPCKPTIGQKDNEKQENNARRTARELLGHFLNKISLYVNPKPFPGKIYYSRNAATFKTTITSQKSQVRFRH